jgi:hypothetical protein
VIVRRANAFLFIRNTLLVLGMTVGFSRHVQPAQTGYPYVLRVCDERVTNW